MDTSITGYKFVKLRLIIKKSFNKSKYKKSFKLGVSYVIVDLRS